MATYKILGQVNPTSASTLTSLYTVPSAKEAFCSTLSICNFGATTANVTVVAREGGAAIDPKQHLLYNIPIVPADSLFLTLGISLYQSDIISVSASTTSISFGLFGSEI
jgi:hypothetical protein